MWSDLAPAAARARSDGKWLHITAARRRDAERLSNDQKLTFTSDRYQESLRLIVPKCTSIVSDVRIARLSRWYCERLEFPRGSQKFLFHVRRCEGAIPDK